MTRDRWALLIGYLILVGSVAWTTRQIGIAVDRVEEETCVAAVTSFLSLSEDTITKITADPDDLEDFILIADNTGERCAPILGIPLSVSNGEWQPDGTFIPNDGS